MTIWKTNNLIKMLFLVISCVFFGVLFNTLAHNQLLFLNHDCMNCKSKISCSPLYQDNREWSSLISIALEVFRIQIFNKRVFDPSRNIVLAVIHDHNVCKPTQKFLGEISVLLPETQILHFHSGNSSFLKNISHTIADLMKNEVYISSVVVIANDVLQVTKLLDTVSLTNDLTWTSVIHMTEWIVVSPCTNLHAEIQSNNFAIDFFTLIYPFSDNVTIIVQKSRNSRFMTKAHILTKIHTNSKVNVTNGSTLWSSEKKFTYINCSCRIRPHPMVYLRSRKSIMDGLHISAALPENAYARTASQKKVGNDTVFDGFIVALFNLMADLLGFKLSFVYVTDGGDYGEVLGNGTVTGITGKLARREAALAALMSRLESRQNVIDFLPTPLLIESAHIVYRLPKGRDTLDKTYITIFKPEFLLSLVWPLILMTITAVVIYVVTRSCTVSEPWVPSVRDIRNLQDCTENICFHHRREYPGQTARILRGSWSVFWLILVSAYSAYLVTTFTIKPDELKIKTFQDLLAQRDFHFGMHGSSKALPIILKTSTSKYLQETWIKLEEFNKTNPLTFSLDLGYHVKRVIGGHYAFLDNFSIGSGEFYDYVPANQTDIRAYQQNILQGLSSSYIALPKHVFFKDALYHVLLTLEQSGVVLKLQDIYFSKKGQPNASKASDGSIAVGIHRILIVIYMALAVIGISGLCLGAEFCVVWLKRKENA